MPLMVVDYICLTCGDIVNARDVVHTASHGGHTQHFAPCRHKDGKMRRCLRYRTTVATALMIVDRYMRVHGAIQVDELAQRPHERAETP